MYAVVYKNRVIVGPMVWHRGIFQGSLEKEGVEVTLPRVAPEELPMIINEDARICQAVEERPEINAMVEYHYGPIWDVSGDVAVANYEVHETQIENARGNFKEHAAEERYKKEVKGTKVTVQDLEVSIDTNRGSRDIFVQKYLLMVDNETVNWKFPEGWLTLTKEDLGSIVNAGATYVQGCFDWERGIVEQIDAATTKEELLAIEIVEKPEPQVNELEVQQPEPEVEQPNPEVE